MIIGIAGQSGSGKSTISELISDKLNYELIKLDEFSRDLYRYSNSPAYTQIVKTFKNVVVDDHISRKLLADIVFKDKDELQKLNNIIFPLLKDAINSIIVEKQNLILDGAIVLNEYFNFSLDKSIIISASKDIRLHRLINDRKIKPELAKYIVNVVEITNQQYNNADLKYLNETLDDLEFIKKDIVRRIIL